MNKFRVNVKCKCKAIVSCQLPAIQVGITLIAELTSGERERSSLMIRSIKVLINSDVIAYADTKLTPATS